MAAVTDDDNRATALRTAMVDRIEHGFPHLTAPTLQVVRRVPRHAFVPEVDLATAYIDDAVVTRRDESGRSLSSISQPSMVAQMLDMLDLAPGHRVLEIGAGTGYCAALLAELVGPTGQVTTIDIDPDVTDEAHRHLDANGYSRVTVTCADGALGDANGAPWDRILVSVGAWEPAPEWIAQLAPGGRLVMPLALGRIQRILSFEATAYGLRSRQVLAGGFLAQRGRDAGPRSTAAVGEELQFEAAGELPLVPADIAEMLAAEPVRIWTGVGLAYPSPYDGLLVYLTVHHPGMFTLAAPRTYLPDALRAWGLVYGIAHDGAVAHLSLRPTNPGDPETSHEVGVFAYGPGAAGLAARIADDARAWQHLSHADPVFEVYPKDARIEAEGAGAVVLDKQHSRIRVSWDADPDAIEMHLLDEPFELILNGAKTIEVRSADRKRQALRAGDRIRFTCGDRTLAVRVIDVRRYDSFESLYETEDADRINPCRSIAAQLAGIDALYGPEKRSLGAVAIELRLLDDPDGPHSTA
ncbi:methyltransferase, FxLD system [Glycomyces sp. MUSA5-2]|uniref:methyltransferase, FxLD system n=1 Tax=Glycomyces sp. MUSA5-2 TaxID=2053002 RepID=UPI00300B8CA8